MKTCQELEQEGVRVTYLPVNREGIADLQALEQAICPQTALISVMYANNEIGTNTAGGADRTDCQEVWDFVSL